MPEIIEVNCDPDLTDDNGNEIPADDLRRVTERDFTPQERAQRDQDSAQAEANRRDIEARETKRRDAIKTARASNNPDIKNLLTALGLDAD